MDKTTKADRILFITVIVIAAILFAFFRFAVGGTPSEAVVSVDGRVAYRLPLDKDTSVTVDLDGKHNVISVEGGKVRMSEANCPDQVCVHQGEAYPGGPIACLPNRVMIQLSGTSTANNDQPDAVIH